MSEERILPKVVKNDLISENTMSIDDQIEMFGTETISQLLDAYDAFEGDNLTDDERKLKNAIRNELTQREVFKDLLSIEEIKRVVGILAEKKGVNYFW